MPAEYTILPEENTVITRHTGILEPEELGKCLNKVLEDPRHSPGMNVYRDTRGATFPAEWTFKFFKGQFKTDIQPKIVNLGECKLAWLVDGGKQFAAAHQAGLGIQLSTFNLIQRKIFRVEEEAKEWLGLPRNFEIAFPD